MLDISFIRENLAAVKEAAAAKQVKIDLDRLIELDQHRREKQGSLDEISRQRKELAGQNASKPPSDTDIAQGRELKKKAQQLEKELEEILKEYEALLKAVPNLPSSDTPVGQSEADNKVLETVGEKPNFNFAPKAHWELGTELNLIDSETAAEVAGSRFTYLKNELVLLQFALIQYAFQTLTDVSTLEKIKNDSGSDVKITPFTPIIPPFFIRPEIFEEMARLEPKEDRYYLPEDDLYLIGSAEHTLGPLQRQQVVAEDKLPLRYAGFSTAFRRESGSYGQDVRGILRLHQFDKIEIESFTLPEKGLAEQEFIVAIQKHLLASLEIPFQVVLKCTADMGTPNARAVDLESWLPGQDRFRETHTSDYMSDYQSRRLGAKVKHLSGKTEYLHMNDATVFALGRTLIALLENHQQADGSVKIPSVLHNLVSFTKISPQV